MTGAMPRPATGWTWAAGSRGPPRRSVSRRSSPRGACSRHEAAGLKDRGVSGSLAWDPDPASERGPSLTLSQTLGAQAAGGADSAARAANTRRSRGQRQRLREPAPGAQARLRAAGPRRALHVDAGAGLRSVARESRLPPRLAARAGPRRGLVVRARRRGDPQGTCQRCRSGAGAHGRGQARGEVLMATLTENRWLLS